jgi:hypothetical protein
MVNTKLPILMALIAALSGCSAVQQVVDVHPESLQISSGALGHSVSLAASGDTLFCVYSDAAATTLNVVTVPAGQHLPSEPPAPTVLDKVDTAPPLSPSFGAHVLSVQEGRVGILYLDRETDAKSVLKSAVRSDADPRWSLDVFEPTGDPVALVPGANGSWDAFWSAPGGLFTRKVSDATQGAMFMTDFQLGSRPSGIASAGFTAFDSASNSLVAVFRESSGFTTKTVPDAGAAHSSLLSPSGLLSVLSWDPRSRRLELHEEKKDERSFSLTTVTLSNNTGSLALLPGRSPSTYLFLFDESRSLGVGSTTHQVSLIAPGHMLGALGARYRKAVLRSADRPVQSLSAVIVGNALYVLVQQGDLTLLRVALAP